MADSGTYLYAITALPGDPAPPRVQGVAGTPVRTVNSSGLTAYVSDVPLEEFGAETLRRNLEDLAWLERTARAHDRVVGAVARTRPTAPVRLVTVYRDDAQIRAVLDQRAEEFKTVLSRITGRSEWGVKVYALAGPESEPERASPDTGTNPGVAYLKRRRTALREREEALRDAAAGADHIHVTLSAIAVATRRHPLQDPQLSGRKEHMLLNAAYLIDDDRRESFEATARALRLPDLDLQVTGPWAPYSFAVLDEPDTLSGP